MEAGDIRGLVLSVTELPREKLDNPGWPGVDAVWVRTLRGDQRREYFSVFRDANGNPAEINDDEWMAHVVILCVCDESGAQIFKREDAKALLTGPLAPLNRCYAAASRLNAMHEPVNRDIEGN